MQTGAILRFNKPVSLLHFLIEERSLEFLSREQLNEFGYSPALAYQLKIRKMREVGFEPTNP